MPKVIIDKRELGSQVAKELEKLGCDLTFQIMDVADYCVSDRCAFERKTVEDFLKSWLNEKKLFGQLIDLCSYERPILIIEGQYDDLFYMRRVNPNAVQGALNAIAMLRVPMLLSLNEAETAQIIAGIARREQIGEKRELQLHGKRSHMDAKTQKEYVVSAISELGLVVAKNLLNHFGSIERIFTASKEELQDVKLVGPKTAERIKEVVSGQY